MTRATKPALHRKTRRAAFPWGLVLVGGAAVVLAAVFFTGVWPRQDKAAGFFSAPTPIDVGPQRREKRDFTGDAMVRAIQGLWIAEMPAGKATLQISGDRFQMVFVPFEGRDKGYRLFSRGNLETADGGVLVLGADNDPTPPESPDLALRKFYKPLTLRAFAVVAASPSPGRMRWGKGPGTYDGVHGIPEFHPLFSYGDRPIESILWQQPAPEAAPPPAGRTDAGTP